MTIISLITFIIMGCMALYNIHKLDNTTYGTNKIRWTLIGSSWIIMCLILKWATLGYPIYQGFNMLDIFSITNIAFNVPLPGYGGSDTYALSWIELVSSVLALAAVIGARLNKTWWYPLGILNSIGFIAIFYQVQLYSDLLLNAYFIVISVFGWWIWTRRRPGGTHEYRIRNMDFRDAILMSGGLSVAIVVLGLVIDTLFSSVAGLFVSDYVHTPAAMPFVDATTTVLSVAAMYLLAKRYVESWVLWIIIDVICVIKYAMTGVLFLSLEYSVFLLNAIFALYQWNKLKE